VTPAAKGHKIQRPTLFIERKKRDKKRKQMRERDGERGVGRIKAAHGGMGIRRHMRGRTG
jgi:hypothetical protein